MVALFGRPIIHKSVDSDDDGDVDDDDDDVVVVDDDVVDDDVVDDDRLYNSLIELHVNHADLKLQLFVDFG